MEIQQKSFGRATVLTLEGDLDIYAAAEVHNLLLTALEQADRVELKLGRVTELDGAGLQVLIAGKRQAQKAGKEFVLTDHSQVIIDTLELCRLGLFFGDPMLLPARESHDV